MAKNSYTKLPNIIFEHYLPLLTSSELKVLLIIYRQTVGWKNPYTNKRKTRDRITHNQFIQKTGLSRRVLSQAITSLISKQLIVVTDFEQNEIQLTKQRKGKTYMFYQPVHTLTDTKAKSA